MRRNFAFLLTILTLWGCNIESESMIQEPEAKKVPKELVAHGDVRIDEYYWLRERENPEVIDYLNAENAYREEVMRGTEDLQKQLYEEMIARIKQDDASVPYHLDGFYYYTRFEEGKQYPIYCRRKGSMENPEEVLLNVNELAEGHDYYQVSGIAIRPDKNMISFGVDTLSRRIYTIHFKDLTTGEILEDQIPNTSGSSVWAEDNQTLFYSTKDEVTLRQNRVMKHHFGKADTPDEEVYFEADETFVTFAYKTKSKKYIMIGSTSTLSDEYRYIPADRPNEKAEIIQPRVRGLEYSVSHFGDHWYIRTNQNGASNFKLMRTSVDKGAQEYWENWIPHRAEVYLEGFELFRNYYVLEERSEGLTKLRIRQWNSNEEHAVAFDEETYTAGIGNNPDFDTEILRYGYSSLTTPASVIDYNMSTREKRIMKEQEVVGGYDKSLYRAERVWSVADDGVRIPVSLVYRADKKRESGNPLLLYGYGSYGYTVDPSFSATRLSLLDRGFVFAIAHIRGGQYMGREWYETGKLLKKRNSFTDFIRCGEFLVEQGYTSSEHLYAMGGSAGGLLMGAVVNMKPELFKGVVAAVPFVDVVTTMLDESIPLTTGEYDEWGNPNDAEYYHYMKSYSPYDNVAARNYPAMLITTGLHDSQVQYWEPAKWIARLRDYRTDKNKPLLMFCNMKTGHGGASGRFDAYLDVAMEYAFLLDLEGLNPGK